MRPARCAASSLFWIGWAAVQGMCNMEPHAGSTAFLTTENSQESPFTSMANGHPRIRPRNQPATRSIDKGAYTLQGLKAGRRIQIHLKEVNGDTRLMARLWRG